MSLKVFQTGVGLSTALKLQEEREVLAGYTQSSFLSAITDKIAVSLLCTCGVFPQYACACGPPACIAPWRASALESNPPTGTQTPSSPHGCGHCWCAKKEDDRTWTKQPMHYYRLLLCAMLFCLKQICCLVWEHFCKNITFSFLFSISFYVAFFFHLICPHSTISYIPSRPFSFSASLCRNPHKRTCRKGRLVSPSVRAEQDFQIKPCHFASHWPFAPPWQVLTVVLPWQLPIWGLGRRGGG